MDTTIHQTYLPHDDPDASLAFYRDTLGFAVRNDVEYGGMHWITVGPADQPGERASLFMAGVRRPLRGSLASSVLATVRPLPPPEVKPRELVPRTEVARNG